MKDLKQLHENAKLIAVEDVMRCVRLLAGWGQYPQFIESPGSVFDKYDEMSIEELHEEKEKLEALANQYVCSIHPVIKSGEGNINRILGNDEQDYED